LGRAARLVSPLGVYMAAATIAAALVLLIAARLIRR